LLPRCKTAYFFALLKKLFIETLNCFLFGFHFYMRIKIISGTDISMT